jgi:thiosulfate/3-mercaptopyruvate sulfurtransferase
MIYTTLVSVAKLAENLENPDWVVVDCHFSLADPELGRRLYQQAHIPGAIYAHLDEDMCSPVIPGKTGRHPLPELNALAERFSSWGIDERVQVVAYDASNGALVAVRLWWLLRWLGHPAVAVLDGGLQAWQAAGYPVQAGQEQRARRAFTPHLQPGMTANTTEVDAMRLDPQSLVVDSRAVTRYRGENETIDPVAGHIPGAVSAPYEDNLDPTGHMRDREALRARFQSMLGSTPPEKAVFYCGSGVTAIHNLLALAYAGLGDARLYPGSWSEWITDPGRPIATGAERFGGKMSS